MSCGVGQRRGLDPRLLWLWHRLAATAPLRPLAWEPLYATCAVLEKTKKRKNKKEEEWNFLCGAAETNPSIHEDVH